MSEGSDRLNDIPRYYSERRALIAEKLSPYFPIAEMVSTNTRPTSEAAEMFWDNSLWCSWGDRETGYAQTVTVSVCQVADGEQKADDIRDMMEEECSVGLDLQTPNPEAYEIAESHANASVFVLGYLERVTAIVGNCVVDIWPFGTEIELSAFTEVALDIGRSVGCSAYENDFTSADFPDEWRNQTRGWSTPGFPPYIPGLSDPQDPNTAE